MAKKLGSLFFSTVKRISRLQRQAVKLASAPAVKRKRKKAPRPTAAAKPAEDASLAGQGSWQNLVHKTTPSKTELLGRLGYSLYKPPGGSVAGLPLVVMLHGCQQTAHELALGSGMNRQADNKGFVVIYPQQTRRVQALRCWRWFQPDGAHGFAEADAVAELASAVVTRLKLDSSRVYIAGMSAGAGMAGLVALRHPRLFAAVAMHSGAVLGEARNPTEGMRTMRRGAVHELSGLVKPLLQDDADSYPGMPALILHGERDHVVAQCNARQLAQQFVYVNWKLPFHGVLADGPAPGSRQPPRAIPEPSGKETMLASGTSRQYQRLDFLRNRRAIVRLCLIKSVGHAWSGGDARQKFNAREGPKATFLIWQFFDMHCRGE